MTLYLLFERLDAGKIRLDTPLNVSEHASEQSPTKLDLKPGQTIAVEDAIKGIVTRSANDAAVVIAENLGGDEESFAKLMTQKARALGMTRTTYVNASGLPDDDQITTARDQALLGRAIQDRFPRYYKYFSTESFVYRGESIRTHNHLLGAIDGMDGIKTGFTRASGFNLLASVHRDGRFIVGVVMGGRSAPERDAHMRELISDHIKEAALHRTAPMLADGPAPHEDAQPQAQPLAFVKSPMAAHAAPAPLAARFDPALTTASPNARTAAANDPIRPLLVRTITYRMAPVQSASLGPMPALVPVGVPAPVPAPQPASQANAQPQPATVVASADPANMTAVAPRADLAMVAPARNEPATAAPTRTQLVSADAGNVEPDEASEQPEHAAAIPSAPAHARGGWLIQIGAFDDEDEAKQHLTAAQAKLANAAADPFTERVQKGDKALYRARFAGFDKATAEAACKQLKRSDFACMAMKD